MRYEGSIAIPGGRDELIYFDAPDDIDVGTAENMVRELFDEQLMWFRPAPPIVPAIGFRDESYPFSYLVFKNLEGSHLLQVLSGDKRAWGIIEHNCGDCYSWKDELPNGLYIVDAVFRIKDNFGATDWNSEFVTQVITRPPSGPELLKIKRGELLC